MNHIYNNTFFDYIDHGARSSAQTLISSLMEWLEPRSVLDLGCGRGVWLAEWQAAGAVRVLGVDGSYVDQSQLAVHRDSFMAADLTKPVRTDNRFDLAQSLEVGEHLPESAAKTLVASLTRASDRVLFSAAVTGQGGEFHVNEQPLSYWQGLFALHGYRPFDCVRPAVAHSKDVEPWYRYNTVLYVNDAGRAGLPEAVLDTVVPEGEDVLNGGDFLWRLRRSVVQHLPRNVVTQIAQARAGVLARAAQRQVAREA